ncbi:hypothetical protein CYY_007520 [Polysphondylium violaceum]|uniref:Nucleolar complex protein 2 homolog n=1 Tax=Polysphondylium violaceum TaxID=133409 RepID=A0A8J4PQV0_9MYCE|nr:hypothetical protein CYY_007520 [Polysphondylium violaceum]
MKVKKSTKKLDVQALKKQRRFQNKVKKGKKVSDKSLNNFREESSEEEQEFEIVQKQPIKNTKIQQDEVEEDDSDLGEIEGDDDDADDSAEESDLEIEQNESDVANLKKKDKKEVVAESEKTKSLKSSVKQHKEDLAALKEKDPKLFEYLSKQDASVLNFGQDEEDDEEDDESSDDEEDLDDDEETSKPQEKKQTMTSALLESWVLEANKNTNLQNVKKLILAFRSAARTGSDLKDTKNVAFRILNSDIFNRTIIICLQYMPTYFDKLLEYNSQTQDEQKPELPSTTSAKWKQVLPCINSFIKSIIHLLTQVSEAKMLLALLKGLEKVICYVACFNKYSKLFLKQLLQNWSSSQESVRVMAFLCIRKLAIYCPFPFIDDCLKGIYLNFARNSKFITATSLPIVNFMCNCVVEIYGLDFASSYRSAFMFIRQLAIHLRNTLNTNTKEAFQNIYNWQFINSIRAWVEVLAAYPKQEHLQLLLYPVTQIIIGIINLIPSSKFLPLRFHCIRFLNRLASSNGLFINATPYLLDILNSTEMKEQYASKKSKFINFYTALSASHPQLKSKEFQDGVLSQFVELLVENLECYSCHIGFPELCAPVVVQLKKSLKMKYRPKVVSDLQSILEAIEKNVKLVRTARDKVSFSPKESKQVAAFTEQLKEQHKITPLKQLLLTLRKRSKQEQQVLLESQKVYNYEDDEEDQEEGDDDEDDEMDGMEQVGDEEDEDDEEGDLYESGDEDEDEDEEEEEQVKPKSNNKNNKKQPQNKKPKFQTNATDNITEDLVEDLVLSDNE